MATPGSAVNPKKKKPSGTTTAGIINAGTGGVTLGGSNPYAAGGGGVPSTATIDGTVIPILDAAGDDPWQLGQILPNVGAGHAPQSVGARVASVANLTAGQQEQLAQALALGGFIAVKSNYTTTEVQDALTAAFKVAQETGAGSLSRVITERNQKGFGANTGGSTTIEAAQKIPETTYSPQDIQDTANAEAQKLVGRNATPTEVQLIANVLNQSSANKAQAAAASEANAEQQDIATRNAYAGGVSSGGALSIGQLEQLWTQAGGDPNVAPAMAAIAMRESGGNPGANNYNDTNGRGGTQTSWGLWQISDGTHNAPVANINDPLANAKAAVAKYNAAAKAYGDPFQPWGGQARTNAAVQQFLGSGGGQPANQGGNRGGASFSPVSSSMKQGRTDQGVDYSGQGQVFAVGSGTIVATSNPGWPGGAFIALKLDNPVDAEHSMVYYAEDIAPNVKVGDRVQSGAVLGQATGGSSGVEIGWADPQHVGQALAATQGGYTEGKPTQAGSDFLSYVQGGTSVLGAAKYGNTTDVYQNPVITQVPSQESPADAAAYYYQNQDSPDYQKNNLLNVFEMIENNLKSPVPNQKVRGTALSMRPGA